MCAGAQEHTYNLIHGGTAVRLWKTLLAVAGVTVLLGAVASTALAGRLSTSSQQLRATFGRIEMGGSSFIAVCSLTLEGSFHERTTAKVAERLVGYVTRAGFGSCSTGAATVLTETLPWHVRYQGFTGTLPNISTVRAKIIGAGVRVRENLFGVACLLISSVTEPTFATFNREASGSLTSVSISGEIASGAECSGARGGVSGTSNSLTVQSSATRITVTLI
jgi:hypothetical protein